MSSRTPRRWLLRTGPGAWQARRLRNFEILQLCQGHSQPGYRSRGRRVRRACRQLPMRQVCAVRMIAELEEINTHRTRSTRGHFAANRSVMGQAPGVSLRGMSASRGYRSLMGQGESSFGADAFGRLCSRSALDGVSWVQGGSVEIAVGQRLAPATESAPSSAPSLGRRSSWELDSASCLVDF
jgi:hypothetical protein